MDSEVNMTRKEQINAFLFHFWDFKKLLINGEGEIHFRVLTADTGTSGMVKGM